MKICANMYVRYRYSKAIQSVLSLSLSFHNHVILVISFLVLIRYELDMSVLSTSFQFNRLSSILLSADGFNVYENVKYNYIVERTLLCETNIYLKFSC